MSTHSNSVKSAKTAQETLLFEGGSNSSMRMVSVVALTFALGSFGLAGLLLNNNVKLGGVGVSDTERAIWAGGMLLMLVGFFAAVSLYRRRVASRITLLSDGRHLRIETPAMFGRGITDVSLDDLVLSRYHEGDKAGEDAVATPWLHVQMRNQRSFVVPLSGNIPDKQRLMRVLSITR
jgi:hypothetical protein